MKKLAVLLLALPILIIISTGCSSPNGKCPELGLITNVEKPVNEITMDNRLGCSIPDFTWDMIDCSTLEPIAGQSQTLSDFQGKPVMVIFHKTMNCPGCKAQMPFIKAAYEQRTNEELIVLTVYRGDGISDVKRFVTNLGYIFTAIADSKDEFATYCGFPVGAPITIFIDSDGKIRGEKIGPFKNQEEITSILNSL